MICEHEYLILDKDIRTVNSIDGLEYASGHVFFYCTKCLDLTKKDLYYEDKEETTTWK